MKSGSFQVKQRRVVAELDALQAEALQCLHPILDALLPALLARACKGQLA